MALMAPQQCDTQCHAKSSLSPGRHLTKPDHFISDGDSSHLSLGGDPK